MCDSFCRSPREPVVGVIVAALLGVATVVAAQNPPLGEVARQEAERRKDQPAAGKVYTNKDLPASAQDRGPVPSPYVDPSDADRAGPAPIPSATPAPSQDDAGKEPVRDEAWWRNRIADARKDLRSHQAAADALQARINALSRDFVSRDNPVQRAQIGEARASAIEELALTREAIARSEQEVADIEEEARRASVPPGWLR